MHVPDQLRTGVICVSKNIESSDKSKTFLAYYKVISTSSALGILVVCTTM